MERTGEDWTEPDARKGKERRRRGSKRRVKGTLVVPETSTRESRALGPGGYLDPAELTGGDAPPCAEPPVAPTRTQGTKFGPLISATMVAERLAPHAHVLWY